MTRFSATRIINAYSNRLLSHTIARQVRTLAQHIQRTEEYPAWPAAQGRPPVILLGMHRSGTTLLSRLLREAGLSLGHLRGADTDESLHFQNLNRALLRQLGASWDHPDLFQKALQSPATADQYTAILGKYLTPAHRARAFMGKTWSRHHSFFEVNQPWGWKDPRTCYTFPLYHRLFPEAKVIFIHRHGVDVAQSLYYRNQQLRRTGAFSERLSTLMGGFSLWEEYNQQCLNHLAAVDPARQITVAYEELLAQPSEQLRALYSFAGLSVTEPQLQARIAPIQPAKAKAYQHDPKLAAFYEDIRHRPLMAHFGYQ